MNRAQLNRCTKLFEKHPAAISHLYHQFTKKRLGVVLGAGIGVKIGFPNWHDLLVRIAEHPKVNGSHLLKGKSGKTATAQILFQLFKENQLLNTKSQEIYARYGNLEIHREWKKTILDVLYVGTSDNPEDWLKAEPYLKELVDVIRESNVMTVTYNFDDTIERLIRDTSPDIGRRKCTTVWDFTVQGEISNQLERPVIYHPNGFLARDKKTISPQMVLLDDSFEDQLVDSFTGHYNALNFHYSSKTCLLLGISLEDRTLKHMLRMNARKHCGHVHYLVQHLADDFEYTEDNLKYLEMEKNANFETYNLYTLHLTSQEIGDLLGLMRMPPSQFISQVAPKVAKKRRFFVMGCVSVGKSTTVSQFKSLGIISEWTKDMPEEMTKAPSMLSEEREQIIDEWVAEEVALKNVILDNQDSISLTVIDRTPIDAFAFIQDKGDETNNLWQRKAELFKEKLGHQTLVGGKIIFLKADAEEIYNRTLQKVRQYSEDDLDNQQEAFLSLIKIFAEKNSASVEFVDVTNKTAEQVAKEVAKIIYYNEYEEVGFQSILDAIQNKGKDFVV